MSFWASLTSVYLVILKVKGWHFPSFDSTCESLLHLQMLSLSADVCLHATVRDEQRFKHSPCTERWLSPDTSYNLHSLQTLWTCSAHTHTLPELHNNMLDNISPQNTLELDAVNNWADTEQLLILNGIIWDRTHSRGARWEGFRELWPVMVHQHVDQVFEESWLRGAEETPRDLIYSLLQLGDPVVVGHSIIPEGSRPQVRASSTHTRHTNTRYQSSFMLMSYSLFLCHIYQTGLKNRSPSWRLTFNPALEHWSLYILNIKWHGCVKKYNTTKRCNK